MKQKEQQFAGLNILEAMALKSLATKKELTENERSIYQDLTSRRNYYLRNLFFTYSILLLPVPKFK